MKIHDFRQEVKGILGIDRLETIFEQEFEQLLEIVARRLKEKEKFFAVYPFSQEDSQLRFSVQLHPIDNFSDETSNNYRFFSLSVFVKHKNDVYLLNESNWLFSNNIFLSEEKESVEGKNFQKMQYLWLRDYLPSVLQSKCKYEFLDARTGFALIASFELADLLN